MIESRRNHLRGLRLVWGMAATWLSLAGPSALAAVPDLSVLCDQAAWQASKASGVPISVLKAISLTETGRKHGGSFRPWPWTVNMEGKGVWFETEDEARTYVYANYKRGARSFDVGCFQINFKWHGQEFASIEEMFEPEANALYAARFLTELYLETGDWTKAAGAYHSRTPLYADKYAARFDRFRADLIAEDEQGAPENSEIPDIPDIVLVASGGRIDPTQPGETQTRRAAVRVNTFPLLQPGGGGGMGSLVPLANGGGIALFGPRAPQTDVN